MGQLLRIPMVGEPWQLITVDNQETAAVEVFSRAGNYPRFRIIKFLENKLSWENDIKELSIRGKYSNIDEKEMKRYRLDDGLYLLQWSEVGYKENWKPIEICQGSYWKIVGAKFSPIRVSPDKIAKAYEEFKRDHLAHLQRSKLSLVTEPKDI